MKDYLNKWRRFVNESALSANELPLGWKVLVNDNLNNRIRVELHDEKGQRVGYIIGLDDPRIPCVQGWSVEASQAPKGYGPLLYDILMELSGDKGIYSDRTAVSSQAQKIWEFYQHQRDDVESFHPIELSDEHDVECTEDLIYLFGEEWDENEPTNRIYRKIADDFPVITTLKAGARISFT